MVGQVGKNIVVASALKIKYPIVFKQLNDKITMNLINCENNEWCRDYMPIKNGIGEYVLFEYQPHYLTENELLETNPNQNVLISDLGIDCIKSKWKIDGGAVQLFGNKALISNRVFKENCPNQEQYSILYKDLKEILAVDELIVLPEHPFDFTGHLDGLVRFIDENNVVINDLNPELELVNDNNYKQWHRQFHNSLESAGLKMHSIPYLCHLNKNNDSAVGLYLNYLITDDLIIVPQYGFEEDKIALLKISELYNIPTFGVKCNELAKEGGAINCVTWN